jgi:hypothetical protein
MKWIVAFDSQIQSCLVGSLCIMELLSLSLPLPLFLRTGTEAYSLEMVSGDLAQASSQASMTDLCEDMQGFFVLAGRILGTPGSDGFFHGEAFIKIWSR